jgi:hypothetical protein
LHSSVEQRLGRANLTQPAGERFGTAGEEARLEQQIWVKQGFWALERKPSVNVRFAFGYLFLQEIYRRAVSPSSCKFKEAWFTLHRPVPLSASFVA